MTSVAIAPDGRTALSGSADKTLKLWDLATGKELRTFTGHSERGCDDSVAIASETAEDRALGQCQDRTLKLWDLASGKESAHLAPGHFRTIVTSVAIAPDGRTALSASGQDAEAVGPGQRKRAAHLHRALLRGVISVAIAPDGRTALSGS